VRVLLITHEASRTGAPRIAALVARRLVGAGHDVRIVTRRPGPLEADFRDLAPTEIEPFYRVRRRLWLTPGAGLLALLVDTVLAAVTVLASRADVVYLNSTASVGYLRPALWLRRAVVLHGHESAEVAPRFVGPARAGRLLHRARLVGCSPSVQAALAGLAGVPVGEVALLPSVPDGPQVEASARAVADVVYRPGEIVVGCCGSVEHRKGADLWLQAARLVRQARPDAPVRFVWVGEVAEPALIDGAPEGTFVGPSANPYPHLARFDVATLPSRDDPFPLVVLEAMLLGTPVVAFGVGGVPDQVGSAGVLVPQGEVAGFAAAIVALVDDPDRRRELGRQAGERVAELYSVEAFGAGLIRVMESATGAPAATRSRILST
jgi:glycosyltransferase involved in cell wall biosynthesis